jgi:hypothetical protein
LVDLTPEKRMADLGEGASNSGDPVGEADGHVTGL